MYEVYGWSRSGRFSAGEKTLGTLDRKERGVPNVG